MTLVIMPLLWLCLAAGAGGCNPKQDPTGPRPAEALTATEVAGIRLTYMCGNTFRVRNPNGQEVVVTWDVYKKNETGSLTLAPKPAGAAHSETFFTTVNKGTVRLFYNGQLIQTKANGNKPPCPTASDTTKPPMPSLSYPDDPEFVVSSGTTPEIIYYRRLLGVVFHDSTSGVTIRQLLSKYQATIVGGMPFTGTYILKFDDPGTAIEALSARRDQVEAEPGVKYVLLLTSKDGPPALDSRYPVDGAGFERTSWFDNSNKAWALRAIRAPLSWGCETGAYGSDPVSVGVVEWSFDQSHPELSQSVTGVFVAQAALGAPLPGDQVHVTEWHGTAVSGMLTAAGDNSQGVPGLVWRSSLTLYAMGASTAQPRSQLVAFAEEILPRLLGDQVRLVNFSIELTKDPRNPRLPLVLADALRKFMQGSPGTLIVKAAGNFDGPVQPSEVLNAPSGSLALIDALLRLRAQGLADRIIVVSGTAPGNQFDAPSGTHGGARYIVGQTDILAPSRDVALLGSRSAGSPFNGDIVMRGGTSFAAPMVAGVAAQLLAMDPTLTPVKVKEYILRGAQEPKEDPATGIIPPAADSINRRVQNAPGPIYQLDAYGALTLLSRERHGTPLCGVEVVTQHSSATGDTRMIANRASPEVLIPDQPVPLGAFSVAQGGRLFAVQDASNGSTIPYQLTAGAWQAQTPITDAERVIYLERDTAYLRTQFGGRFDLQVRLNAGNWATVTAGLPSGTSFAQYSIPFYSQPVSPTGDYIYAIWGWANGPCVDTLDVQAAGGGAYRIPLRGGGAPVAFYTFSEPNTCDFVHPTPSQQDHNVVWRRDGRELIRATWIGELGFAQLRRHEDEGNPGSLVGTSTPVGQPSRFEHLDWSPEGGRLLGRLLLMRSSTCILTVRQVTALDHTPEPDQSVGWQECPRTPIIAPLRQGFLATGPAERGGSPGGGPALAVPRPQVSPLRRTAPQEFRLWAN